MFKLEIYGNKVIVSDKVFHDNDEGNTKTATSPSWASLIALLFHSVNSSGPFIWKNYLCDAVSRSLSPKASERQSSS